MANLARELWPAAGYWDLAKQPQAQLENLEPSWKRILAVLRHHGLASPEESGGGWDALGKALHRQAAAIDTALHGSGTGAEPKQTVIHGDAKAANFFFRHRTGVADERPGAVSGVGFIDFQWTGLGICATDVAYCLVASACPSTLFETLPAYQSFSRAIASTSGNHSEAGGCKHDTPAVLDWEDLSGSEEHLLRHYYGHLLATHGSGGSGLVSYETFLRQYRLAFLDYCRVSIACFWDTPGNKQSGGAADQGNEQEAAPDIVELLRKRQSEGSLVFNASNKNLDLMLWMLRRMKVYLSYFEEDGVWC